MSQGCFLVEIHGHYAPHLRNFAMQELSQFQYTGTCELVWSDYGFIHAALRKCLGELWAQDLVNVHGNARLLAEH